MKPWRDNFNPYEWLNSLTTAQVDVSNGTISSPESKEPATFRAGNDVIPAAIDSLRFS